MSERNYTGPRETEWCTLLCPHRLMMVYRWQGRGGAPQRTCLSWRTPTLSSHPAQTHVPNLGAVWTAAEPSGLLVCSPSLHKIFLQMCNNVKERGGDHNIITAPPRWRNSTSTQLRRKTKLTVASLGFHSFFPNFYFWHSLGCSFLPLRTLMWRSVCSSGKL